ncbi:hypothetical protein HYR99_01395 [Candidatus Poribacteria bacterium]|nr:hypothetical protein [Candidatus Poribacteria bacterium]
MSLLNPNVGDQTMGDRHQCFVIGLVFVFSMMEVPAVVQAALLANTPAPMAHCNQQLTDQMSVTAVRGPVMSKWHFTQGEQGSAGVGATVASDFIVCTFGKLESTTAYDDTYVYVLNFDGTIRWHSGLLLNGQVWKGGALIDELENVYVADNNVAIKFAKDGTIIWSTPHPGGSSPISFNITDEGLLVAAGEKGPVWLANRNSGAIVGQRLLTAELDGNSGTFVTRNTPSVYGTRVYLLTEFLRDDGAEDEKGYGRLYALETSGGQLNVLWFFEFGGPSGASPTVIGDRIYFDGRKRNPDDSQKSLFMFGLRDKRATYEQLWAVDVRNEAKGGVSIVASPAVDPDGGLWMYVLPKRYLLRLDELTGDVIQKLDMTSLVNVGIEYTPSSAISIALNLGAPMMYVGVTPVSWWQSGDCYVLAIEMTTGTLAWKYNIGPAQILNNCTYSQLPSTPDTPLEPLLIVTTLGNGVWALGTDEPLPVGLSAFEAVSTEDGVLIRWRTESEQNNLGFNIYRSERRNGEYEKLNVILISGAGSDATPHKYEFVDENVRIGQTYYYYLEDVNFSRNTSKSKIIEITVGQHRLFQNKAQEPVFVLLQNYPNPFNLETWIPYQLGQEASVAIRIDNQAGRLIRSLQLGNKPAGAYISQDKAAYWDGRESFGQPVASGVYYYTLQTGQFTATRAMVVLE